MEHICPYCGEVLEHDGMEEYVQCPHCAEISQFRSNKLHPSDLSDLPE